MDTRIDFLYLSEEDTIKADVRDMRACIEVCEEVFSLLDLGDYRMSGNYNASHGAGVFFPKESPFPDMPLDGPDRRFFAMPAYLGGSFHMAGCKWYGSNAANQQKGLPRSILMLTLNDPDTGAPVCHMSANLLSAARTGAIAGVGAKHFAGAPSVVTVLGCGPIGRSGFMNIMTQCSDTVEKVFFYDLNEKQAGLLAAEAQELFGVKTVVTQDKQLALGEADIVNSAVSRLATLELNGEWFKKDALVILNSPSAGDDRFWLDGRVVLDCPGMHQTYMDEAQEAGTKEEIYQAYNKTIGGNLYRLVDEGVLPPLDTFASMGQVVNGKIPAKTPGRTVFINGGMGVFDVAFGTWIYRNAVARGIGTTLNLWESPAL